jgi:hypothetical protein
MRYICTFLYTHLRTGLYASRCGSTRYTANDVRLAHPGLNGFQPSRGLYILGARRFCSGGTDPG